MISRYEFKYLLDPAQADAVADRASLWCEPDALGDGGRYQVTSLYLDRADRVLARQTFEGVRQRIKLRVRYYGDAPTVVFAEIKRRVGATIRKLRERIDPALAAAFASNRPLPHDAGAEAFRQLVDAFDARPCLWVRYQRHAFASPWGDGARLTLDSGLEVQEPTDERFRPLDGPWRTVPLDRPVVLEMKFNGAYPAWMRGIAEGMGLRRLSCSKYAQGVELVDPEPWARGWHPQRRGASWIPG